MIIENEIIIQKIFSEPPAFAVHNVIVLGETKNHYDIHNVI